MSGCGASCGLFKALSDEENRLEAHEDIRVLVGQIIVSPGENGGPELLLKGDLAGILSLLRRASKHPLIRKTKECCYQ